MSGLIENFKKGIHALDTSSSEEQILFGFIKLKYEIEKKNFYAMLLYNIILGFCLNGVELMQHNVLLNTEYFNFTPDKAAQYNSFIIFLDLVTKLLVSPIYGGLCDKIGRQKLAIGGCSLTVLSFFMFIPREYPNSSLTQYYIARFINANGITMLLVLPFVADYIDHDSKGRAIGISGLLLAIGFTLSTFVVSTYHESGPYVSYVFFAVFIALLAVPCCWFLKAGNVYYKVAVTSPDKHIDADDDIITNLQETSIKPSKKAIVLQSCKSRPWIIVSYIFAFLNGICLAIANQNLNLFIQSFSDVAGRVALRELGSSVVFKANIASVLTSLIVGPALDFIQPIYVASLGFGLNILGFFCIWTVDDPYTASISIIAISFGMAYAVSQLLSNYLGFKFYPTSMRGFFFSISNIFSLLGIILTTVLGGILFNSGDRNWPFYIAGLCSLMALCAFVYVHFEMIIPKKKKTQNKQELNLSLLYTSIQTPQNEVPLEVDIDDTKLDFDS